jgi:hypothetical protein
MLWLLSGCNLESKDDITKEHRSQILDIVRLTSEGETLFLAPLKSGTYIVRKLESGEPKQKTPCLLAFVDRECILKELAGQPIVREIGLVPINTAIGFLPDGNGVEWFLVVAANNGAHDFETGPYSYYIGYLDRNSRIAAKHEIVIDAAFALFAQDVCDALSTSPGGDPCKRAVRRYVGQRFNIRLDDSRDLQVKSWSDLAGFLKTVMTRRGAGKEEPLARNEARYQFDELPTSQR